MANSNYFITVIGFLSSLILKLCGGETECAWLA